MLVGYDESKPLYTHVVQAIYCRDSCLGRQCVQRLSAILGSQRVFEELEGVIEILECPSND